MRYTQVANADRPSMTTSRDPKTPWDVPSVFAFPYRALFLPLPTELSVTKSRSGYSHV